MTDVEALNEVGRGPLQGVRVVEFAHVVAGPLAGGLLADLGATVVHVEPPEVGDTARHMGPAKDGVPLWWKVSGRNKRSMTVDLRTCEGQEIAHRLTDWADVVIVTLRAGTLRRWGLDWETLHADKPELIYLQVSGYGADSSRANEPGFGKMGEARSGVVALTGFPDGPPVHTGFSHGDSVTGLMGAFAITAALRQKAVEDDYQGEWIDIALFEPLFRLIEWQVILYDQLQEVPHRSGNQLSVAPAAVINTYHTADDQWLTVTSATHRSVLNVVRLLGLSEDAFATREQQHAQRSRLDDELRAWIAERTAEEALAALGDAEVVASVVFTVEDIMKDETYAERRDIIEVADDALGTIRMQAVLPHLHCNPGTVWRAGPELGEDTDLILTAWLGYSSDEVDELRRQRAV